MRAPFGLRIFHLVAAVITTTTVHVTIAVAQGLERVSPAPRGVKPSGFWGSPVPATHGAYRYRLLLLGLGLAALAAICVVYFARNAKRSGAAVRPRKDHSRSSIADSP